MTRQQPIALRARAAHRTVDLGMGGCETFVNGSDIVLSRDTVVELCRLALGELRVQPEPPRRVVRQVPQIVRSNKMMTCGACGCERLVDDYTKRHPRSTQYTRRPNEATDSFYCGCQDDDSAYR